MAGFRQPAPLKGNTRVTIIQEMVAFAKENLGKASTFPSFTNQRLVGDKALYYMMKHAKGQYRSWFELFAVLLNNVDCEIDRVYDKFRLESTVLLKDVELNENYT